MSKSRLDEPVLVLNVNYEPLNICNTKRAVALLYADKADTIKNGRGMLRSGSAEFELPSVIRLRHMVKRPRPHVALSKREILRRDNFTCQYCGRKNVTMTIDHVNPRRLGGAHSWQNLVAACAACNRRKGGELLHRVNMKLKRQPFEPSASAMYRFGSYLARNDDWVEFVQGW